MNALSFSANHIIYNIEYLEQPGKKCSHLYGSNALQIFYKMLKNEFLLQTHESTVYLIDGACLCILFE